MRFECDQGTLVAKIGDVSSGLDIEGRMLEFLNRESKLPVPDVLISEPDLLVMTYVDADGRGSADLDAAALLGSLHTLTTEDFGLSFDTLIGGIHQPNQQSSKWIEFFGDRRLRYMTQEAISRGRLTEDFRDRMETMIEKLDALIDEPDQPSLIHGDVWGGNVLVESGHVAAFIDPAIYYAHYEMELAFIGMFHTFGEPFYDAYPKAIDAEFFDTRQDIYNLYPLLVHVTLFGGGYVRSVDRTLRRFGA